MTKEISDDQLLKIFAFLRKEYSSFAALNGKGNHWSVQLWCELSVLVAFQYSTDLSLPFQLHATLWLINLQIQLTSVSNMYHWYADRLNWGKASEKRLFYWLCWFATQIAVMTSEIMQIGNSFASSETFVQSRICRTQSQQTERYQLLLTLLKPIRVFTFPLKMHVFNSLWLDICYSNSIENDRE